MMIGTSLVRRMARHTSKPSMPGQHDVDQHDVGRLALEGARAPPRRCRPPRRPSPRPRGPASPRCGCARRPRRSGCGFPRSRSCLIQPGATATVVRAGAAPVAAVTRASGRRRVGRRRPGGRRGRAAAGAVVEALGQARPEVAAADEGAGPGVGERLERAEVDVDPLGPAWTAADVASSRAPPAASSRQWTTASTTVRPSVRDGDRRPPVGLDGGVATGGGGAVARPRRLRRTSVLSVPTVRVSAWSKRVAIR